MWVSVQPPPAAEPTGGTLVVSVPRDITVFDPAVANTIDDGPIVSAICSTLLRYPDEPGLAGLRLAPDAARAAPIVSDGGRSFTFVIRPGSALLAAVERARHRGDLQAHDRAQSQPAQEHGPRRLGAGSNGAARRGRRRGLHGRQGAAHCRDQRARRPAHDPGDAPRPRPTQASRHVSVLCGTEQHAAQAGERPVSVGRSRTTSRPRPRAAASSSSATRTTTATGPGGRAASTSSSARSIPSRPSRRHVSTTQSTPSLPTGAPASNVSTAPAAPPRVAASSSTSSFPLPRST